jgi:hypothetical protein
MYDDMTDPVDLDRILQELDEDTTDDDENYFDELFSDGDALASAGWGTDEDYGYFGQDDY